MKNYKKIVNRNFVLFVVKANIVKKYIYLFIFYFIDFYIFLAVTMIEKSKECE